jgi:ADP-ribosylglycohydrolase
LAGLATGDAIGKQTETLSHDTVVRWYLRGIRGFEGSPGDVIPRYARNTKRRWLIGETTDDTERTLAVARAILRDGQVHHDTVGRELLACTKCVHPGLKSLWQFHQAADPSRITDEHDGCEVRLKKADDQGNV